MKYAIVAIAVAASINLVGVWPVAHADHGKPAVDIGTAICVERTPEGIVPCR